MGVWCSPLILGGNLPKNDAFELALLTNEEVLAVDQNSINNRQIFSKDNHIAWVADIPDSNDKYVVLFNANPAPVGRPRGRRSRGTPAATAPGATTAPQLAGEVAPASPATTNPALLLPAKISLSLADIGITGPVKVRDLWAQKDIGIRTGTLTAAVNSHGAVLYRVSPQN